VTFRFVDLFAGIGGFHLAMERLGGSCALAVEIDDAAQHVYRTAFPETPVVGDIRSLTRAGDGPDAGELDLDEVAARVPDHDVLCGGFPCQPFSKSGAQLGLRDRTRGTLFFDVMTIILAKQPRYVILENVRNLAGPRHRDTWDTIVDSLRGAGYIVSDVPVVMSPHLLSPEMGGAPQVRDRVFILAERADGLIEDDRFMEPLMDRSPVPSSWDPHEWDVRSILDNPARVDMDAHGLRAQELMWLEAWQTFCQEIESDDLPGFPIWVDAFVTSPTVPAGTPLWKRDFLVKNSELYREHRVVIDRWMRQRWGTGRERVADFPPSRRKFEWQARRAQPARKDRDLESLVAHMRPSGIRVKPATYLPALVAITQTSIIGPKVSGSPTWRRLTPVEAARLQGMEGSVFAAAGVADSVAYRQLGNAVNVGVVAHVARALFESSADHRSGGSSSDDRMRLAV
jgi:DNA (cytosine-5)-methyltransferase 1